MDNLWNSKNYGKVDDNFSGDNLAVIERYIVVDDDAITNLISKCNIRKFQPNVEIVVFQNPEEALDFIRNEDHSKRTILLLDLNMPELTGWEFLDEFSTFSERIKKYYLIFILSSSLENFYDQVQIYPELQDIFSKPLSQNHLAIVQRFFFQALQNK